MGKLEGGINGRISGKVGNMVFYASGDEQWVRAMPGKTPKPSPKQLANQESFKIKQAWLKPIAEFLKVGCKNDRPNVSGSALAMKYLCAHAISGAGGETQIDPEKMLVSIGGLSGTPSASVELDGTEAVFSWDPLLITEASPFDQALILAYNVKAERAYFHTQGHFRRTGSARLPLFEPGDYHCYLGFVAADRSQQSNSQYLGKLSLMG